MASLAGERARRDDAEATAQSDLGASLQLVGQERCFEAGFKHGEKHLAALTRIKTPEAPGGQ